MSAKFWKSLSARGWLGTWSGDGQGRAGALWKQVFSDLRRGGLTTMVCMSLVATVRAGGIVGVALMDSAKGPLITDIVPGSPAEAAGLRIYSTITHVQGQPVAKHEHFSRAIDQRLGFGQATLTVDDGKATRQVRVGILDRRTAFPASTLSVDAKDAMQEIDDKGGQATYDNQRPGKPLVGVKFYAPSLTDKTLKCISQLPDLEWILIEDSEKLIPGEGWTNLAQNKKLRAVHFRGNGRSSGGDLVVNPAILKALASTPGLRKLELSNGNVGPELAAQLANFTDLRGLVLAKTDLTDGDLQPIGKLTNLEYLDLTETNLTGVGLQYLSSLKKLRSLDLTNNPVTDEKLGYLNALDDLAELELSRSLVTDSGLKSLNSLKSIKYLGVNYTGKKDDEDDDTGFNPNFVPLNTALYQLMPQGSDGGSATKGITLEEVARFLERYPRLDEIEVRGPVFEPSDLRQLGRRFPQIQIETSSKTLRPGDSE